MIKTIKMGQLRAGMYVHNLHRGWLKHPFLFSSFLVEDDKTLRKLLDSGIGELEIDTDKGADVGVPAVAPPTEKPPGPPAQQPPPRQFAPAGRREDAKVSHVIPLQAELRNARAVLNEAHRVVRGLMSDVKMGRALNVALVNESVDRVMESILRSPDAIITLNRLKQKDDYTFQHSVSVSAILIAFCRACGLDDKTTHDMGTGGLLHDVGKMLIPDSILLNPGRLTPEEFSVMQTHSERGKQLLEVTPGISRAAVTVAFQHHERRNGSGYPARSEGPTISRYGQMAALADVYDAATSQRPYHRALEPTAALREIFEKRGEFFDPELVQQFITFIGVYPPGALVLLESGILAIVVEPNREEPLQPVVRAVYDTRNDRPLHPRDLDLSRPSGTGVRDRITGYESPERWKIDPLAILLFK